MTLLDIRNQILDTLCTKDTFSQGDFEAIEMEVEHEDQREDLIKAALQELSEIGMVRQVGGSPLWILTSPMNSSGQELGLSMETCNWVAKSVNAYLDGNDIQGPRADALNINEGAIIALLKIIDTLLQD